MSSVTSGAPRRTTTEQKDSAIGLSAPLRRQLAAARQVVLAVLVDQADERDRHADGAGGQPREPVERALWQRVEEIGGAEGPQPLRIPEHIRFRFGVHSVHGSGWKITLGAHGRPVRSARNGMRAHPPAARIRFPRAAAWPSVKPAVGPDARRRRGGPEAGARPPGRRASPRPPSACVTRTTPPLACRPLRRKLEVPVVRRVPVTKTSGDVLVAAQAEAAAGHPHRARAQPAGAGGRRAEREGLADQSAPERR